MAVEWLTSGWTGSVVSYSGTENNDAGTGMSLGTMFSPVKAGFITHIRFWKVSIDTATSRTVGIYNTGGTLLYSTTTSAEPVGVGQWIDVTLTTPMPTVNAAAGTNNYIATVYFDQQKYAATAQVFSGSGGINGQSKTSSGGALYSIGELELGFHNGLYQYATPMTMPATSAGSAWYWVDVGWELTSGGGGGTKKAKQQVLPQSLGRLGL